MSEMNTTSASTMQDVQLRLQFKAALIVRLLLSFGLLVVAHLSSRNVYGRSYLVPAAIMVVVAQAPNLAVLIAVWNRLKRFPVEFATIYAVANFVWAAVMAWLAFRDASIETANTHGHVLIPLLVDAAIAV